MLQISLFGTHIACTNYKDVGSQPTPTLLTHRQRMVPGNPPIPRVGLANFSPNNLSTTPMLQRASTGRSPLTQLNGNNSGFAGYGMSAGLKVSNPAGSIVNNFRKPIIRSRGL
jgi:E3 ubiquitin-protein ligase CCNP1IP1